MKTPSIRGGLRSSLFRSFSLRSKIVIACLLMPGLISWTVPIRANPSGGVVVHGDVSFGVTGNKLQIDQNSPNAIINWNNFSIDAGELTKFVQPGVNSAVLNRVVGGNVSEIHGALQANGNVFVINPNGILVGAGGTIDVYGLVLSTLDVSNGEFLAGGDQLFKGRNPGNVTNMGRINAIGGDVFLIGKTVTNSGSVTASNGTVGFAAGEEVLLTAGEDLNGERLFVRAKGAGVSGTGIFNDGTIEGAAVELKAHGNAYALAINNKGSVRATGVRNSGGKVFLSGVGGTVDSSGSVVATAPSAGNSARVLIEAAAARVDGEIRASGVESGGEVVVEAREIEIGSNSEIDVSGSAGGSVRIGGGVQGRDESIENAESLIVEQGARILANGSGSEENAGSVVLWSDGTTDFSGEVSARADGSGAGGFVEVSGKETLLFEGTVSTLSAGGNNGTLLLDPTDFQVIAGGAGAGGANQISNTDLVTQLGMGNVVISTSGAATGGDPGTITVEAGADVDWNDTTSLTLLAYQNIDIFADIQNQGAGGVHLVAGWDGTTNAPGVGVTTPGAPISADSFSAGQYGLRNGMVAIGAGGQGVSVGSKSGVTQVAASGLAILGSTTTTDAYAQLGYRSVAAEAVTGDISTFLGTDGLNLNGGTAARTYAQLGHGGRQVDGDFSGLIDVEVAGNITVRSGSGADAFAQIGHGGLAADGAHSGNISVISTGGSVIVHSADLDGVDGTTDVGDRAYAQIGHGGLLARGGDDGGAGQTLTVNAANNVELHSGGNRQAYAMIGTGGYDADADSANETGHVTDISVEGGTDGSGSVILRGGRLTNGGDDAFVQIGNGGSQAFGDHGGSIEVIAADDVILNVGADVRSHAQIGHGGYNSDGYGAVSSSGHEGAINVTATGGDVLVSGAPFSPNGYYNAAYAYAQLGHGGHNSTGSHAGDIVVSAGDLVSVINGTGDNNYKQIGHGGTNSSGSFSGSISVTAENDINVRGGGNDRTYALLGHGGFDANGDHSADFVRVVSNQGAINVIAGGPGAFTNNPGNAVSRFAQIGLGGVGSGGNMSAPLTVTAEQGIHVQAGGNYYDYAQIGNGGWEASGDKSGAVLVTSNTGEISVEAAARAFDTYTMIGHGGVRVDGTLQGDVTVSAANGIELLGGRREAAGSFAQIGHGGLQSVGNKSGAIQVDADNDANGTGDLDIIGGSAEGAYALIGHGGIAADGFLDGSIDVLAGGVLDISGGSGAAAGFEGNMNFGQIGHSLAGATGGFGGFMERDGRVVVEAEFFDDTDNWQIAPEGGSITGDAFTNSRGGYFIQAPDGGVSTGATTGSYATYKFTVTTGGVYRLTPRWSGWDGSSDSHFYDIVELKDGNGGTIADWYEFTSRGSEVFGWDNTGGGFEQNAASDDNAAPLWNLVAGQEYTLRITPREDGVAVDAWMLQLDGMANPSGVGPGVTFVNESGVSGASDISVTAGGNITMRSGAESDSYAAIGHGGSSFLGVNSNLQYGSIADGANISVTSTTGNILLDGNSIAGASADAARRYSVIGHHGVNAGFDAFGNIDVHAGAGTVNLSGGNATDSFAQVGHSSGGFAIDDTRVLSGEICVVGADGVTLTSPNSGERSYAQAGHGGYGIKGDFDGNVTVVSSTGAVNLNGGSSGTDGQYAQIGHGGIDADGVLSGDLKVVSGGGDTTLAGGGADNSYAMIGHGDGAGSSDGSREGGIHLFSSGQLSASNGAGTGSEAHLFHQSGGGLLATDYLNGDGLQVVANGGLNVSDESLEGVNTMIAGNIANGPISLAFSNDIDLVIDGPDFVVDTGEDFYLMTGGDITLLGSYQNAGTGDVLLVAGWNGLGATFNGTVTYAGGDFCMPEIAVGQATFDFNTCANFGNNNGMLAIGNASQTSGVSVGSLQGMNGVAAYGMTLQASDSSGDAFSQFGFRTNGAGAATGSIDVNLKQGGLILDGGSGDRSFSQVGHGGYGAVADGVDASVSISFCEPGIVDLQGGNGLDSYAQIGHGGAYLDQTNNGSIEIVDALHVDLDAGTGFHSDARIGHGGYDADGAHSGSITISAQDFIDVTGGFGQRAVGQIGHGGYGDNSGANSGDISLTTTSAAGGVHLVAGSSTVGSNTASYVHVGHGGYGSAAEQRGDITINSGGDITLSGGNRDLNYKQIGHGGRLSNLNAYGAINLTAAGDVNLSGGTNDYDYAQVGHGGANSQGFKSGTAVGTSGAADGINVTSTGGQVTVHGGDQNGNATDGRFAYAQIGMGGAHAGGPFVSDVDVSAASGVDVSGGGRDFNYARIGHGGDRNSGSVSTRTGNISVSTSTGDITLRGGRNHELASAAIGHGGNRLQGNATGSIHVHAIAGSVSLESGGGDDQGSSQGQGSDHSYSSAQIGHGGSEITTAGLSGEICVVGFTGVELNSSGSGDRAYTLIGHGGYNVQGDMDGAVTVTAPDGGVTIEGGSAGTEGQFAQIGHGGILANGLLNGDVFVVAGNGDTSLAGGAADNSYAMIGNGDGAKTSQGSRQGGVHLFSSGQLTGTNGAGTGSEVYIFHQNNNGLQPADYLGGDGYQKIANGGVSLPGSALVDESTMINGNLGTGLVQILDNSDTDYVIDASNIGIDQINSGNDFFIITGGNITMLTSFQNSGTGDVTLVAGWNGTGTSETGTLDYGNPVNFCEPEITTGGFNVDFNNCDTFGNNGRTITIGSTSQTEAVRVGSAGGVNSFAAAGIELFSSDSTAMAATQLGFYGDGSTPMNGAINLYLKEGGLAASAGVAEGAYTQIGHSGVSTSSHQIDADISVTFCEPSPVSLIAGGVGAYSQIGHGGGGVSGDLRGSITVSGHSPGENAGSIFLQGSDSVDAYVQVGHGGIASLGNKVGDITIDSSGDLDLIAGGADRAFALIGNGGIESDGFLDGNIGITAEGEVNLLGGGSAGDGLDGEMNFSMIGHSLEGARGGFGGFTERNGMVVAEGEYFTDNNGWIVVSDSHSGVEGYYNNSRGNSYALLPNGAGTGAPTTGPYVSYNFEIVDGGSYDFFPSWTGYDGGSDSIYFDIISQKDGTGDTIADWYMFSGRGSRNFGWDSNAGFEQNGSTSGGSVVNPAVATWNLAPGSYTVRVTAREDGIGVDAFVLQQSGMAAPTGLGPAVTFANVSGVGGGNINVEAGGDISVRSGINTDAFAAIGHGGSSHQNIGTLEYGSLADGADIRVSSGGDILLDAGSTPGDTALAANRYSVIGHHGVDASFNAYGDVEVEVSSGSIELNAGNALNSFAQIGHSSAAETGAPERTLSGDVRVSASGTIELTSGALAGGHTQIGHGGTSISGAKDGIIDVMSDGLSLLGGAGESAYSQVGHGGVNAGGNIVGTVNVLSSSTATLEGGDGESAYMQIGHGGVNVDGDIEGSVTLAATGAVEISGGAGDDSFAKVGHGGSGSSGEKDGDVSVSASELALSGNSGDRSGAHVGHGGYAGSGNTVGSVDVITSSGGVSGQGGSGDFSGVQIGHGGGSYQGISSTGNDVTVTSATDISFQSGDGNDSSGLIGHGGFSAGGVLDGNIRVEAVDGDIRMLAGGTGSRAFTHIGHSAISSSADLNGNIDVFASGNVIVVGGTSTLTFSSIGHGGAGAGGNLSGDIKVNAGDDILLAANSDDLGAYAKIGHGDDFISTLSLFSGGGTRSGDIQLGAWNDMTIISAMVGHSNQSSPAMTASGNTYIAASRSDVLTGAGIVFADSASEFSSADSGELRFYFPGKTNNQIAAGTLLNGTAYIGTSLAPNDRIREDEFVNVITGAFPGTPGMHENLDPYYTDNLASGAAMTNGSPGSYSTALGNYSLYYHSVQLEERITTITDPEPPVVQDPDVNPPVFSLLDLLGLFPDDTLNDDDQRKHQDMFSQMSGFSFHYEGYDQYGPNGESTFSFSGADFFENSLR